MKGEWLVRLALVLLLAAWSGGLVVAELRLSAWESESTHTLLQIRADRAFRVRMAERKEPIPREWYRSKALALLAAGDKLQDDSGWTLVVPGSWHRVDSLRERLSQRIEREFSEIAVDTIRRELEFRASQLTGVPLDSASGELLSARGCADPRLPDRMAGSRSAGAAQALPELQAAQSHLAAIEQLDQAVQALTALQSGSTGDADSLRLLVRYTLGAELVERPSRSATLFRQVLQPADPHQQAARTAHLQQAVRCSFGKRMALLDTRMFDRNDLLTSESALSLQMAELLHPGAAPQAAVTLERWHEVVALISQQETLLAQDENAWLRSGGRSLGPVHDALLAQIERIPLLGVDTAQQLRRQSGAALQRLRQQLAARLATGKEPALMWLEGQDRFALSPQRVVLRDQLSLLLREPFMAPPSELAFPDAAPAPLAWDVHRLKQVLALRQVRKRFSSAMLPKFPPGVRPAIARSVDGQLAQQAEAAAVEAMSALSGGAAVPLDSPEWHAQRQQAAKVQSLLVELGARPRAQKLRALLAGDVVQRLAPAEQSLAQSELYSARLHDFSWWQGDGSPILAAFGVADSLALRLLLAQQVSRFDSAARQAAPVLEEARAGAVNEITVLRWQGILSELERYRSGRTDSSLLMLERTLLSLGSELQGANCSERLAAAPPRSGLDEFTQRYRQIHEALSRRCSELRASPAVPSAPPAAAIPFG